MKRILFMLLGFLLFQASYAQLIGGNSLSIVAPTGEFSETHTVGIGFYGNIEYQISKLAFVGEVGWAQWSADEDSAQPVEDYYTWSITAGLKFTALGPIYLETRTGYYFKELEEVVLIPALGLRFGRFDMNMGANVLDPTPFLNLRLGYYWAQQK